MLTVLTPQLKYEIVELIDERIREKHVTREDFTELKSIVRDIANEQRKIAVIQKETREELTALAKAQKETQEELKLLSVEQKGLAKAQKETREDLNALAKAQKETREDLNALAKAQKETREELTALAKAQKEMREELTALAKAQKETQEEIKLLTQTMNETLCELSYTRRDVGGITATLGYMLENEAYRMLPNILKDRYGIEVKERFLRRSIKSFGVKEEGEINIFSHGVYKDSGIKVVIIGEAKSLLSKNDIDDFLDNVGKLKKIEKGERFLLAITHYTKETVIEYAKEKGVEVIQSFEW